MSTEAQPLSGEQALPNRSAKRPAEDDWVPEKARAVAGPDQETLDAVCLCSEGHEMLTLSSGTQSEEKIA